MQGTSNSEDKCPVCGSILDIWGIETAHWVPKAYKDIVSDNFRFNRCWDCRKFVPDVVAARARFWKELES